MTMLGLQLLVTIALLIERNCASFHHSPCQTNLLANTFPYDTSVPNINSAFVGFDPLRLDPFSKHNPEMRQRIFEPLTYSSNGLVVLNRFVGKAQEVISCYPDFATTTIKTYTHYKARATDAFEFALGSDVSAEDANGKINFKLSAGYGRAESEHERRVRSHFQKTSGEIAVSATECITHSVAISQFVEPVFTEGFKNALKELHVAADNPDSEESNSVAKLFFMDYGTHFLREAKLGSKLWLVTRWNKRSSNYAEQLRREECAEKSAYASLAVLSDGSYTQVSENTTCPEEIDPPYVLSVGAFPILSTTISHPVLISATVAKISEIFRRETIKSIPQINGNIFNATKVALFIEYKMRYYCELLLGRPCEEPTACSVNEACEQPTSCFVNGTCTDLQTCQEDPTAELGYTCKPLYGSCEQTPSLSSESHSTRYQPPVASHPYEVARGKKVASSPHYGQSVAGHVVDGNNATIYHSSADGSVTQPWIVIDLEQAFLVDRVRLLPYARTHAHRFKDVQILLGDFPSTGDFSNYTVVGTYAGPPPHIETWLDYTVDPPRCSRYVAIYKHVVHAFPHYLLEVREVEVMTSFE